MKLDRGFHVPGYEEYEEDADQFRRDYNAQLDHSMRMYGIRTEAELMSGYIEKLHAKVADQEKNDIQDTARLLKKKLIEDFRQRFNKETPNDEESRLKRASAWYFVTYGNKWPVEKYYIEEGGSHGRHKATPTQFLSFPWVVSDLLAKIYARNAKEGRTSQRSVTKTIGISVYNEFRRCSPDLISGWKSRQQLLRKVKKCLKPLGHVFISGLSAAMLFGDSTRVELVLVHRDKSVRSSIEVESALQKRAIHNIKDHLYGVLKDTAKSPEGLKFSRLAFQLISSKTQGNPKHNNWAEISAVCSELLRWSVIVRYLCKHPFLLPICRLMMEWISATELLGPRYAFIDLHVIPFMLLNMCLRKQYIHPLEMQEADELYCRALCGENVYLFPNQEDWEKTIVIASNETLSTVFGRYLLDFFRGSHEQIDGQIDSSFDGILCDGDCPSSFRQLLGDRTADILLEEMDRAFHCLSLHSDASVLFRKHAVEKLFFIDMQAAWTILGNELQFSRFMQSCTGADDIEVYPRPGSKAPGLVVKAAGTAAALSIVEKAVWALNGRHAHEEKNKALYVRGLATVEGAHLYLIEGSETQDEIIVLEDYYSSHHPHHDNLPRYVVRMSQPPGGQAVAGGLNAAFTQFQEHFKEQLKMLNRYYSHELHGDCDLFIRFGKSYVLRPPRSFVEDGCVSVRDLLEAIDSKRRHSIHPLWQDAMNIRRPSTRRYFDSQRQKYKNDRGPASFSFFSRIENDCMALLYEWMKSHGYQTDHNVTEKYALGVARDGSENVVYFDKDLQLQYVRNTDVRWLVTDVKRSFQTSGRQETSLTGTECDIRFMLRTLVTPDRSIKQSLAEGLEGALYWPADDDKRRSAMEQKKPLVRDDLMDGHVFSLRHEKRAAFCNHAAPGALSQVVMEVTEYKTHSRPAYGEFKAAENYLDVRLKPDTEPLLNGIDVGQYLEDLWRLAFSISDVIQQRQ